MYSILRNLTKKLHEKTTLDDVRNFSKLVNKKLEELNKNDESKVEEMNLAELNDLNKLLQIADYILCSYEEKKDLHSILKKFVGIINESIYSIEKIDDKTNELIISADSTITKIKDHQTSMNKPLLNTNKSEKH